MLRTDSGTSFSISERGLDQMPPIASFERADIPEVSKHVHQEQGIAFRSGVHEVDQILPERVAGKLQIQIASDILATEKAQSDLAANPPGLELPLQSDEGVIREKQIRRTIRGDGEQPQTVSAEAHVGEEIDGRCVRPVNVIEEEDDRSAAGQVLEEGEQLTFHPFLGGGARIVLQPRRPTNPPCSQGAIRKYQVGASSFMDSATRLP